MAGSYKEARRRQTEGSLFENQGDAEEAIADTLAIVDHLLPVLDSVLDFVPVHLQEQVHTAIARATGEKHGTTNGPTEGPWAATHITNQGQGRFSVTIQTAMPFLSTAEIKANAQFIATSPEMMMKLVEIHAHLIDQFGESEGADEIALLIDTARGERGPFATYHARRTHD